jgi:pyruvate/2-oxoglutarate dehydrogenase complex dihydrolipoamide dehydrogenase (E3) component
LRRNLIKIVAAADTKQILGTAVLGVTGDEVIHGILNMMNAVDDLVSDAAMGSAGSLHRL